MENLQDLDLAVLLARVEFYEGSWASQDFLRYVRANGINIERVSGYAGATGLMPIIDCGNGRFDWRGAGEQIDGFICEALDEDGETVVDLVAWPLERPRHVMTLLGRAALLGLWEAMNPASYYLDQPLRLHREPLGWLRSGCRGAAVVHRARAARILIDLPGKMAAEDRDHARDLRRILTSAVPRNCIVVPRAA